MYLLIDLNQLLISNLMMSLDKKSLKNMDEGLIRHMCVNTLRSYVKQFKSKYPNVILCCDNRHYWRKDFFPFYKAHRKFDREASELDWNLIFDTLNKLRDELKQNFPYKVLDVQGAEADDVIAVLSARLSPSNEVMILSSDKDFGQLQKYANVSQYSPTLKRLIKIDNPSAFIKEHVIRGDRGDGIPNFLSPDNVFVTGGRQRKISSKRMEEWLKQDVDTICETDELLRGFKRNQTLIDFDYIPVEVQTRIVDAYESATTGRKDKLLEYFMKHDLMVMLENVEDF